MELEFNGRGKFVSNDDGKLNYQEVLNDFKNAKEIRVITYNISKNTKEDELLDSIQGLSDDVDIKIITNVPNHFDKYYDTNKGNFYRRAFQENVNIYLKKLNPDTFSENTSTYFNFKNHSKIVGTENIVYIGSANFSNESKGNIESGILIYDTEFIQNLYNDFFEHVIENSLPYYDDEFMELKVLTLSLYFKFKTHLQNLLDTMYFESPYTKKNVFIRRCCNLTSDDIALINMDMEIFSTIYGCLEDTYMDDADDENASEYNEDLEEILEEYNNIDVQWLIEITNCDEILDNYVRFDIDEVTSSCLEEYAAEAYDEYLEYYADKAMDDAQEIESDMLDDVENIADRFLNQINAVITYLQHLKDFINKYSDCRVNSDISQC